MSDSRAESLSQWLLAQPVWCEGTLTPLTGDASFRRYFRWQGDHKTAMAMDAPPPQEDVRPFLAVRDALANLDVTVPACYAQDVAQGFLLLEDFGDVTLAQAIRQTTDSGVDILYRKALSQLAQWQTHDNCATQAVKLPAYDAPLLVREMQLLPDWLLKEHLDSPMSAFEHSDWQNWLRLLTGAALSQPQTFVHRDYHSRNLMVTSQGSLGVLDFQDAVRGALTYDAVSLLRDAYVKFEPEQVQEWLRFYFLLLVEKDVLAKDEWTGFVRAFDWIGVQRHIKVLGIFARLYRRDGKDRYLANLPSVLDYTVSVAAKYAELKGLAGWLEKRVMGKI